MKQKILLTIVAALIAPVALQGANVFMTADDGFGTSSFNAAGHWDSVAAPAAGNDYFNGGFLLRTPADANSYTFAGDSLTITGPGLATAAANNALMWKGSGTTAIITVNNLTIDGGQLRHGQSSADTVTFAGNINVGALGANFATQGGMIVAANLIGSQTIRILDSGNTDTARLVTLASGANTFTGSIELFGTALDRTRLALAPSANLNFVIGNSGVNNSVFGTGTATFNGIFDFDLTSASTAIGSSWAIASAASQSFGGTFSVSGFTDMGGGLWDTTANGALYEFNTGNGVLSVVPEPGSAAILLSGLGLLFGLRRFRKA